MPTVFSFGEPVRVDGVLMDAYLEEEVGQLVDKLGEVRTLLAAATTTARSSVGLEPLRVYL